jgi:hypothetical protein
VERPEDGVDVILVVRLLLEVEDVHLDLADVLEPLGDEVPQERFVWTRSFPAAAAVPETAILGGAAALSPDPESRGCPGMRQAPP